MNINFSGPINSTGYGISSWNILKHLYTLEPNISYFPIGQPIAENQHDHDLIVKLFNNSQIFDYHAPFIKIWHQFDLANHIGKGQYFALSFFELDTFNNMEKRHLMVPDTILVTCEWAKNVMLNNGINTNIKIIPLGVDREIFDHTKYDKTNKSIYTFMNIGKWELRKGHDILLELFKIAFPNETDVELCVLASESTNNYSSPEELQQWKSMYASDHRVKIISGVKYHSEIAEIINYGDCGIFPSRAEGWNLELLETMSMNKPVIATSYSAHTEFCNNNNSYLVDIDNLEKAFDGKAFIGQGNWAKIDQKQKDQIIDYMRYCYKNKINTNTEGVETAKKYTWANSSKILLRCIQES